MTPEKLVRRFLEAQTPNEGKFFVEGLEPTPEDQYSAGNVYYCPDDDTVFLTKRSGVMHHPYKWDIPGGRSEESDKTVDVTARREAEEELAHLPKVATPVTLYRQTFQKEGRPYHYYMYLYAVSEEEKTIWTPRIELDKETAGFKWFKFDELPPQERLHLNLSWVRDAVASKGRAKTASFKTRLSFEVFKPRYENKYLIPMAQADEIRRFIAPYVTADDHGKAYTIKNIYLDNDDFRFYADHLAHKQSYFKLRARTYENSREVFLEVKGKENGVCKKSRSSVSRSQYEQAIRTASASDPIPFIRLAYKYHSKPVVALDYNREAYNAHEADGRLTIDTNIRYARHHTLAFNGKPTRPLLADGSGILELKFSGSAPLFMVELVDRFKLAETSFSKYCLSVDGLIASNEVNPTPEIHQLRSAQKLASRFKTMGMVF